MNPDVFNRQLTLIDPRKLDFSIAVVGAGGIGSWATLALLRLGCQHVTVIDYDKVEEHNIGSQIYTEMDIGNDKVGALVNKMLGLIDFDDAQVSGPIQLVNQKIEENSESLYGLLEYDVVILAVDDMDTRRLIFEVLKGTPTLLIDGRMAGNAIELYSGQSDDQGFREFYNNTFFPPNEAVPVPCTERSVVYNCFVMAGMITDLVARKANEQPIPKELVVDLANFTMFKE